MGSPRIDPDQAAQVMLRAGAKPLEPFVSGKHKWKCICLTCKKEIMPQYSNVRNGSRPCIFCVGLRIDPIEAIDIIRDAGVEPLIPFPGAKAPWKSRCSSCKRVVAPQLQVIQKTGFACAYCSGRRVDLKEVVQVAKAAGVTPLEPYSRSAAKWKCKCNSCGRVVYPTHHKMKLGQLGCGWCARVRIDPEEAVREMLKRKVTPLESYPGAQRSWRSRCNVCHRDIEPKLSPILAGIGACVYCAERKVDPDEAYRIMIVSGAKPLVKFPGSNSLWKSKCLTCMRTISPNYQNVRNGHKPCAYCSGNKIDPKEALSLARSRKLKPLEPFPGNLIPWQVKCLKCKRKTTITWAVLRTKKTDAGCSNCTAHGFKPQDPAILYVITHEDKAAHKVGIANLDTGRVRKHELNGWRVVKIYDFEVGRDAYHVEQSILLWLRKGLELPAGIERGDGWTETVPSALISTAKICNFIKNLV